MFSDLGSWRRLLPGALLLAVLPLLPASAQEEKAPPDRALILVKLPADAVLTIGSSPTRATGPERRFESPRLDPGRTYSYELKATWTQDGKPRTVTREAVVQAGKITTVDFTQPRPGEAKPQTKPGETRSRTFLFTYAATVTGLKPGEKARIWLPLPPSNDQQEVKVEAENLPAPAKRGEEPEYGNRMLYLEAEANGEGKIPLSITYRVTRREVRGEQGKEADELGQRFLQPDRLVPIEGKPLELIKEKKLPPDQTAAAKVMYDAVNTHMTYSKEGKGWGRGDSVWACDSRFGNCTDFHSLFISLARAHRIPAKFEMGFPIPEKRGSGEVGGYHCWAWFRPQGKGWVPVDISEANKDPKMTDYYFGNLTEDRVMFTTGRDITLVPKQDGEPLNFFIYPYVEVGGKPYPLENVQRKFTYQDVN